MTATRASALSFFAQNRNAIAVVPSLGFPNPWELRNRSDDRACALFDRHYSRRPSSVGKRNCVGPARHLVFVTHDERAVWATTWPKFNADRLFRNEGEATSSDLIRAAMQLTAALWPNRPTAPAGWVTFIDKRKVASSNPGYCFKKAGWWVDPEYRPGRRQRHLIRLRAVI